MGRQGTDGKNGERGAQVTRDLVPLVTSNEFIYKGQTILPLNERRENNF